MNDKLDANKITLDSLLREISQKTLMIAKLQANLFTISEDNAKLKKQIKKLKNNKKSNNLNKNELKKSNNK